VASGRSVNVDPNYVPPSREQLLQAAKGIGTLGLDFTPVVGDVKALGYDLPKYAQEGDKLGVGLSLLSAIPLIPNLNKLRKLKQEDLFAYSPSDPQKVREAQQLMTDFRGDELYKQSDYIDETLGDILSTDQTRRSGNVTEYLDRSNRRVEAGYETLPELQERLYGDFEPSIFTQYTYSEPKLVHYSDQFFTRFDPEKVGIGPHLGTVEQALMRSQKLLRQKPTVVKNPVTGELSVKGVDADFFMPEYVIRAKNILDIPDVGTHSNPFAVLNALKNSPNLTSFEKNMFNNTYNDLLENYLSKIQDMRLGIRKSESGLYVPDKLSSSLDLIEGGNVPPVSILLDTFVNRNVAEGAEKFTQQRLDELLGLKKQFGPDMPEKLTQELTDITKRLSEEASFPLRDVFQMEGRQVFTEGQRAAQKVNLEALKDITKKLKGLGFDTISYENVGEVADIIGPQKSFISLSPDESLKFRDARMFDPTVSDLRYAKGGIVSLRRH
jgi:hypothetical protein